MSFEGVHGIGNGYRGQGFATGKSILSDGGHGIGNDYRGQIITTVERLVSYGIQACEILQLIKRSDVGLVFERGA